MCSGSEAGSYSRLADFVYHSTLGLRVTTAHTSSVPKSVAVACQRYMACQREVQQNHVIFKRGL